ncbi:MAG TPA: two-component regulator propeller domain-containing protein [Bacteroidales bacterium]|nr:two-component regulator propeller domain-containing protein [Bacteroidales bacterium]
MIRPHVPACIPVRQVVLAAILLYPLNFLFGQENYFEKIYTIENGLCHNSIMSIAQDSSGFLWLGTWDGLSRFDGYEFRNYYHNPNDSTSIPFFSVQNVVVDKHNNVWIFAINAVGIYIRSEDHFNTISKDEDSVLMKIGLNTIKVNPSGELWIGGTKGIAEYNNSTGKFFRIKIIDSAHFLKGDWVIETIDFDNYNNIWIGLPDKYVKGTYDFVNKKVIVSDAVPLISRTNLIMPNGLHYLSQIALDLKGHPWLLSNYGCMPLKSETQLFNLNYPDQPCINEFKSTNWYKYRNSIIVYSPTGTKYTVDIDAASFPRSLLLDKDGTIWYCTYNKDGVGMGLHAYYVTPDYFRHHFTEYKGESSMVYSVVRDKNKNLLIGSQNNNFVACLKTDGTISKLNLLSDSDALRSVHPRSMAIDSGGVWLGYMHSRLDYLDKSYRTKYIYLGKEPRFDSVPYGFRVLYLDRNNRLLIGTIGLFLYTPDESRPFRKIWSHDGDNIYCIHSDSAGNIWAGSNSKIIRLNDRYEVETIYPIGKTLYSIEDLSFGKDGTLWLALLGGGIENFDPKSGKVKYFTTADGLSHNTTYSILRDKNDIFWITTDNGISRFNPETGKFRIYGYTDGLKIHEFNSDAAFMAKDGEMYFGGMGGVVSFYPDSLELEPESSSQRLIITDFTSSGISRYFDKPVYECNEVKLKKGDNNFGVSFATIDFRNAEKISYRYRLSGESDNWVETGYLQRRVNFAGLKPGKYLFEVESTSNSGEWVHHVSLLVTIPPFFYQTSAFLILLILLFLAIAGYLIYLYNRRIRMQELNKQHYLKLESIRGQMNPHFIFNSLNSINYFIAKSDRISANRYIANFSKLIRAFLNNMAQDYIPLAEEIATISDYLALEYLRFGDKFTYEIDTSKVEFIDHWEVFPGMAQPFIENAIWHGVRSLRHKGFLSIRFIYTPENGLYCLISDDGIGRKQSEALKNNVNVRKSRGISLIRERLQIINNLQGTSYNVVIDDLNPAEENCGTLVRIDIPSRIRTP